MPAIEYAARSYASAAELKATAKAAHAKLMGPIHPPEIIQRIGAAVVPAFTSDDEYARILASWIPNKTPRTRIHPHSVAAIVGRHFDFPLADVIGPSRRVIFIPARHIAMFICVKGLGYSNPRTAYYFGDRDHSTVVYACRKIKARMAAEPDFAEEVTELMRRCGC